MTSLTLRQGMQAALAEAQRAKAAAEVPIGAVLEYGGEIVYTSANSCHAQNHPLKHAEFRLLELACQQHSQQAFRQSTLYVTLEPCPMCMGAILHAHVGRLVFGAYNLKWGACGTVVDLSQSFPSESIEIYGGILETESADLLASFFSSLR